MEYQTDMSDVVDAIRRVELKLDQINSRMISSAMIAIGLSMLTFGTIRLVIQYYECKPCHLARREAEQALRLNNEHNANTLSTVHFARERLRFTRRDTDSSSSSDEDASSHRHFEDATVRHSELQ